MSQSVGGPLTVDERESILELLDPVVDRFKKSGHKTFSVGLYRSVWDNSVEVIVRVGHSNGDSDAFSRKV